MMNVPSLICNLLIVVVTILVAWEIGSVLQPREIIRDIRMMIEEARNTVNTFVQERGNGPSAPATYSVDPLATFSAKKLCRAWKRRVMDAQQMHGGRRGSGSLSLESGLMTKEDTGATGRDLTPDQIADFQQLFEIFDADGSGEIGATELRFALQALGHNPTETDINNMMAIADTSGDGEIDFDEFVGLMVIQMNDDLNSDGGPRGHISISQLKDFQDIFDKFDDDKSGSISMFEMKEILTQMGQSPTEDDIRALLLEVDQNSDGEIDFGEFIAMMVQKMKDTVEEEEVEEAFKVRSLSPLSALLNTPCCLLAH